MIDDIPIDDVLTLRALIKINEGIVAEYEAQRMPVRAAIAQRRLMACTKKLAEIENAAEAEATRGGDAHV